MLSCSMRAKRGWLHHVITVEGFLALSSAMALLLNALVAFLLQASTASITAHKQVVQTKQIHAVVACKYLVVLSFGRLCLVLLGTLFARWPRRCKLYKRRMLRAKANS